jgi:hypothetical protein
MFVTRHAGIYFVEGRPSSLRPIAPLESEIASLIGSNQSKGLHDLKEKMAAEARNMGGNCVADFRYGQRSSFWRSLIARDDVTWHGSGTVGTVDDAELADKVRATT